MNANFFFDRAVRSLDRFQYDKALKYFRKAVEYEPDNPVNHCNMAGILSETGDYKASNDVLAHILEQVDPLMTECYFYMANNYANMEQFEKAEEALVTYLEEDPSGQFLDEAEEMMELLHYELNRPAKLNRIKSREGVVEHEHARALLEEGKFAQAVKLLEEIVKDNPDFLAARNNLALAYYYMGRFDTAKRTIGEVLDQEPGNLHGLCNLAIFFQHEGNQEQRDRLMDMLTVTVPFHQEHVFKLATTMGILGQHEIAYGHFRRLLKDEEFSGDPSLYHYTAVAACNSGYYDRAEKYWRQALKLDGDSVIPDFYLAQLQKRKETGTKQMKVSYHYHLPFEEQFKRWEHDGDKLTEEAKQNPLIRSSFFWALRHGDPHTKLQVIRTLELIADEEVQHALQSFLQEPGEDAELKDAARLVLQQMEAASNRLKERRDDRDISSSKTREVLPDWLPSWKAVLEKAEQTMDMRVDAFWKKEMENLWSEFLSRLYPDIPNIRNVEGWAAALEYLTAKKRGRTLTYEQVAVRYGISPSTVSRYARQMDSVCETKAQPDDNFRPFTENI
ncbi:MULTISPECIES: tetratricopeptide repeat protein [unclassified Paenibacillus]|uniref:tetratricopeptide repeat protein n=2 Tax=unclassified Paenibacillus TaxID=185978 RepID=UPI001913CBD4|nr:MULTISPECIES: tetratricopeptide repeat protein [unclassified Paenibacillus]MCT1402372.1 tetratricopeptide repeat protein [Paenibacillus sp. p3-SID867]